MDQTARLADVVLFSVETSVLVLLNIWRDHFSGVCVCVCVCVCMSAVSYTHLTLPTRRTV